MFFNYITVVLLLSSFANANTNLGKLTATYKIVGEYHAGIAYDTSRGRLLLTSLVSDSIVALDPVALGINDIIGIHSDYHGGLLCTYSPDGSTHENRVGLGLKFQERTGDVYMALSNWKTFDDGGYAVYTLDDGSNTAWLRDTFDMPCINITTNSGLASDLLVTDDGIVYYTDAVNGRIFRSENGLAKELVISDPSLLAWAEGPFPFPFGSNGMAMTEQGTLLVSNSGAGTLVRIDVSNGKSMNVEIQGESGHGWGLLYAKGRLYGITGTAIHVLESDDDWQSATVLGSIDIDKSADGETATTGTLGLVNDDDYPTEIYVTYVRFDDLFGESVRDETSTLGLVTLKNLLSYSGSDVIETNGEDETVVETSTGATILSQEESTTAIDADGTKIEIESETQTVTEESEIETKIESETQTATEESEIETKIEAEEKTENETSDSISDGNKKVVVLPIAAVIYSMSLMI